MAWRSLYHKKYFGGKYIPRILLRFKGQPPIYTPRTAYGEHLQLKPVDNDFAYILTTDKAIITKLNPNIQQIQYYINITIREQNGCGLGHVTYFYRAAKCRRGLVIKILSVCPPACLCLAVCQTRELWQNGRKTQASQRVVGLEYGPNLELITTVKKKLNGRWDSERELSLRRHHTRTTKYSRLVHKFRHRSTRLCVGIQVYQIQWNNAM